MRLWKILLVLMLALTAAPAIAQDADARVIVPDAPSGGVYLAGCYRVQQQLYGPYRMNFCLERRGSYTVTGGNGVRCEGRLTWSVSGRNVEIDLRRTSCNRGVAWSGDSMSCRGQGLLAGLLARIIVPDVPVLGGLRCTYTPAVRGERPVTITARRVN